VNEKSVVPHESSEGVTRHLAVMERFDELEAEMRTYPQVEIPPVHRFAPGMYAREITIPAGTLLTGKIHRFAHINVISKGDISVWTEHEGVRRIQAPYTFVAPPGTRRIGYAHTDTVWTTFHANPEDTQDLEQLETLLIEPHQEWRPVVGYEGKYEISSLGNVRTLSYNGTGRVQLMRQHIRRGYPSVELQHGSEKKQHTVHSLVAAAFIGARPDGCDVNHISGIKTDNSVRNLEYCTKSQNQKHSFRIGLQSNKGERHSQHKLSDLTVIEIRNRVIAGETQAALGREYGIDQSQVSRIARGLAWSHLNNKHAHA
jgi:hypothetical protein